jgi:hypothetical protein
MNRKPPTPAKKTAPKQGPSTLKVGAHTRQEATRILKQDAKKAALLKKGTQARGGR